MPLKGARSRGHAYERTRHPLLVLGSQRRRHCRAAVANSSRHIRELQCLAERMPRGWSFIQSADCTAWFRESEVRAASFWQSPPFALTSRGHARLFARVRAVDPKMVAPRSIIPGLLSDSCQHELGPSFTNVRTNRAHLERA